jgi:hypothetical protein
VLPNGLILCLELAVGPNTARSRDQRERFAAMMLGMFSEDVVLLPGISHAFTSPSLGHFWPRSRSRCASMFRAAVNAARQGETLRGLFLLGRSLHISLDMACPTHAQGVCHYLSEPFERYVDAHAEDLALLPTPELAPDLASSGPEALVQLLALAAQREVADGTKSPWGRILRRLGLRRTPSGREVKEQAGRLIPLAAAHARALIAQFDQIASVFGERGASAP